MKIEVPVKMKRFSELVPGELYIDSTFDDGDMLCILVSCRLNEEHHFINLTEDTPIYQVGDGDDVSVLSYGTDWVWGITATSKTTLKDAHHKLAAGSVLLVDGVWYMVVHAPKFGRNIAFYEPVSGVIKGMTPVGSHATGFRSAIWSSNSSKELGDSPLREY